jgi:hypothetical protein
MSDAGEGLVDAEARLQEQMDAREQERRRRTGGTVRDPEKQRQADALRLARTELSRQLEVTTHPVRQDQLRKAIAEVDKRLGQS